MSLAFDYPVPATLDGIVADLNQLLEWSQSAVDDAVDNSSDQGMFEDDAAFAARRKNARDLQALQARFQKRLEAGIPDTHAAQAALDLAVSIYSQAIALGGSYHPDGTRLMNAVGQAIAQVATAVVKGAGQAVGALASGLGTGLLEGLGLWSFVLIGGVGWLVFTEAGNKALGRAVGSAAKVGLA